MPFWRGEREFHCPRRHPDGEGGAPGSVEGETLPGTPEEDGPGEFPGIVPCEHAARGNRERGPFAANPANTAFSPQP